MSIPRSWQFMPSSAHDLLRGPLDPRSAEFSVRLVHFSLVRALVFTAAATLVFSVLWRGPRGLVVGYTFWLTLSILLAAYSSSLLQWWVSRRRLQMYATSLFLLIFDQVLFAGVAFLSGGVSSGATSLLGVTCLIGGFLLGVQGAVAAALSGGIFFSLLVLMTQGEARLYPPDQSPDLYLLSEGQAAYYYVFTVLMLVMVGLLSSYLAERLQTAGGELELARKRADQAERLAVLGRLAAGLAHEIRNPLGAISGSVQLLRSGTERAEDQELCDIVLRESHRLNDLVSDMLNLSRSRQAQPELTDLGSVVDDVVVLSRRSGRGAEDVELRRLGVPRALILADANQLHQLVWNLVRNAIQASAAGGVVRVRVESRQRVRLSIEDEGAGIDSSSKEQIFDAFFSTRSQGTGLGLAVVKRIVDEHGFEINVESEDGSGATFIVDFGPPETGGHLG